MFAPLFIIEPLLLFVPIITFWKRHKLKKFDLQYLIILYFIILIILTKANGQKWITGRELIPMYPILVYSIFVLIDKLNFKLNYIEYIVAFVIMIVFYVNSNLFVTREWYDDYSIKPLAYYTFQNNKKIDYDKIRYTCSLDFYRAKIKYYYNYDIKY